MAFEGWSESFMQVLLQVLHHKNSKLVKGWPGKKEGFKPEKFVRHSLYHNKSNHARNHMTNLYLELPWLVLFALTFQHLAAEFQKV